MGSNNPENNPKSKAPLKKIELTMPEAANGCTKEVSIQGQKYKLSIPAGAKAEDVFEVRSGNGYVIGTVEVSRITAADPYEAGVRVQKGIKPWMIIAAIAVIAAIITIVILGKGSGSEGGESDETDKPDIGITFEVPSGWVEDSEWHEEKAAEGRESWSFKPADGNNPAGMFVENFKSDAYFDWYSQGGLDKLAEKMLDSVSEEEFYQVLDYGNITIDGVECWYLEYNSGFEANTVHNDYSLFIPVSEKQLTRVYFGVTERSTGGTYTMNEEYDHDLELRDRLIESIHIE